MKHSFETIREIFDLRVMPAEAFGFDAAAIGRDVQKREPESGRTDLQRDAVGRECWMRMGQIVERTHVAELVAVPHSDRKIDLTQPREDPIVAEVREIRRKLATERAASEHAA